MKTKKEYREWTMRAPSHFNAWHVNQMEIIMGPLIDDRFIEVPVIERQAVVDLVAELKAARDALDMLTIGEENRSRLDEVSNLGLIGALKQMDSISRDALTRANNFLKQWEDGDENT